MEEAQVADRQPAGIDKVVTGAAVRLRDAKVSVRRRQKRLRP